jgi:hypothetical protein
VSSFYFKTFKTALKGHHFESTEDIQRSVRKVLNDIPQNAFQERYNQWQHCWKRCVQAQGMYFDVDHNVVDEYIKYNFSGTSLINLLSDLLYAD